MTLLCVVYNAYNSLVKDLFQLTLDYLTMSK